MVVFAGVTVMVSAVIGSIIHPYNPYQDTTLTAVRMQAFAKLSLHTDLHLGFARAYVIVRLARCVFYGRPVLLALLHVRRLDDAVALGVVRDGGPRGGAGSERGRARRCKPDRQPGLLRHTVLGHIVLGHAVVLLHRTLGHGVLGHAVVLF